MAFWRYEVDKEVGRRLDMLRPSGLVLAAELVSEDDWVGRFVQLQVGENRFPIERGVLGEGAVGLLLDIKVLGMYFGKF